MFSTTLFPAAAQTGTTQQPETPLERQLARVNFGISVIGSITPSSSGTSLTPQAIHQVPSTTAGAIAELQYVRSPLVGIQLNYSYARYTENFTLTDVVGTPPGQVGYTLSIQSKVNEYSMGYVAHTRPIFGIKPFVGGGIGAVEFKPTAGGGQGLPPQERVGIYFALGVEDDLFSNFGVRLQYRQVFFGAPDFNQNYLATGARVYTAQPGIGFYLRF